jgi:putative sugar O-methyltransferase
VEDAVKINGKLRAVADRALNRIKLWDLEVSDRLASKNPKSLSELDDYLTLCVLASENDEYFKKFRSCRSYRAILENVDGAAAEKLLSVIQSYGKSGEDFRNLWHSEIGKPYTYHVAGLGRISPTELRYSKIICELENLFGELNGFRVTEIGVGFGGQGAQILNTFNLAEYEFIDLAEPLQLVKRYLKEIKASGKVQLTAPDSVMDKKRDLVISNYAYSELKIEVQEEYFEKVISCSDRGFVIYNHITPKSYRTLTADEFAARIQGAEIFAERPLSHPGNVLVVWGHKNRIASC